MACLGYTWTVPGCSGWTRAGITGKQAAPAGGSEHCIISCREWQCEGIADCFVVLSLHEIGLFKESKRKLHF
jgi:hypothetical protein